MTELVSSVSRVYAQGDDLSLQFTVVDSSGNAADITGFTCKFGMARRPTGTVLYGTETSPATATATLTTPSSGIYTVTVDNAVTALTLGDYYVESEVTDGSSDKSTVFRGYFTFDPTIL